MKDKEIVELRTSETGRRTQRFVVLNRQPCYHTDGRFGLLYILCKAGRGDLLGQKLFAAFSTPDAVVTYLGEHPSDKVQVIA